MGRVVSVRFVQLDDRAFFFFFFFFVFFFFLIYLVGVVPIDATVICRLLNSMPLLAKFVASSSFALTPAQAQRPSSSPARDHNRRRRTSSSSSIARGTEEKECVCIKSARK